MLEQSHNINQAAEILVSGAGTPQERLARGFTAFRRATIISNDWPVEVWEKYNCICDTLLAGGTWRKTIDRMDADSASRCAARVSAAMRDLAMAVKLGGRNAVRWPSAIAPVPVVDLCGQSPERTR